MIILMQEVIRVLHGKKQRQLQRTKIDNLTPQQMFNNMRYYNKQAVRPHRILRHQYQHLKYHPYNDLEHLTDRKMYPLSYVFNYEPLRSNQLDEENKRSKSICQNNQFLRVYDSVQYEKAKQDYMAKMNLKEKIDRDEQIQRGIRLQNNQEEESSMTSSLVSFRPAEKSRVKQHSKLWKKFRAAAIATYFSVLVKKRLRKYILKRKEKCLNHGKTSVQQASFLMQTYYYDLLEQQITQYILLLEKVHKYPRYNADTDILRILTFITSKLNSSSVPKSLLNCLQMVGVNYTFLNFPFLLYPEATRLMVSEEDGCLIEVGQDESLMIGGCLLGIVMLCYNLLYRPWLAANLFSKKQKRQFNIEAKYDKLKSTIFNMGSIIYFIIIDNFIFSLDEFDRTHSQFEMIMKKAKIDIVKTLKVAPKYFKQQIEIQVDSEDEVGSLGRQESTVKTKQTFRNKHQQKDLVCIIEGQNRSFYNEMKEFYPQEMAIINEHLTQWITKTTLAALAEVDRARKSRAEKWVGKINRRAY